MIIFIGGPLNYIGYWTVCVIIVIYCSHCNIYYIIWCRAIQAYNTAEIFLQDFLEISIIFCTIAMLKLLTFYNLLTNMFIYIYHCTNYWTVINTICCRRFLRKKSYECILISPLTWWKNSCIWNLLCRVVVNK